MPQVPDPLRQVTHGNLSIWLWIWIFESKIPAGQIQINPWVNSWDALLTKFWFQQPPKLAIKKFWKNFSNLTPQVMKFFYIWHVIIKWIWHLTKISMTAMTFQHFGGPRDAWLDKLNEMVQYCRIWVTVKIYNFITFKLVTGRLSTGRSGPALDQFCRPWPWPLRSGPPSDGPGPHHIKIHK